jgi:hypothetical protein
MSNKSKTFNLRKKFQSNNSYLLGIILVIILTSSSCASSKYRTNKTKVKVEKMVNPKPQYVFINNQIIILENNY